MGALFYIVQGPSIHMGSRKHDSTDDACLDLFARILVASSQAVSPIHHAASNSPDTTLEALLKGIPVQWETPFDVVNPYGDRRGATYDSMWLFDLEQDVLFLTKSESPYVVSVHREVALSTARERRLTLDDFVVFDPPGPVNSAALPGPYWELQAACSPRDRSFIGRLIQDFGHAWRHLLRHRQNNTTFLKLAHAVLWITTLDFTIVERTATDRSPGGPYAWVTDLPGWTCPDSTLLRLGNAWFVLSETVSEGLDVIRKHTADIDLPYLILTLRHVLMVRRKSDGSLEWTKPEALYHGDTSTDRAIDLLLFASEPSRPATSLNSLPMEIQDSILRFTASSTVAPAKLGCELGLGPPFQWLDGKTPLAQEECKRKRLDTSPVESQIRFGDCMSGISYKPQRHRPMHTVPPAPTKLPPPYPVWETLGG